MVRLVVKFNPPESGFIDWGIVADTLSGYAIVQQLPPLRTFVIEVDKERVSETLSFFSSNKHITNVEKEVVCAPDALRFTAAYDDQYLSQQWAAHKTSLLEAHTLSTGEGTISIAVIDSGLDVSRSEFSGKSITGYSATGADGWYDLPMYYHGTAVASIITANINNGLGLAGAAPNVAIVPIRVSVGAEETYLSSRVAEAILIAEAHGANIINISLGTDTLVTSIEDAIDVAIASGIHVVKSAGNNGTSGGSLTYPIRDDIITVGGTRQDNQRVPSSSYAQGIDIVAPGEALVMEGPSGLVLNGVGTSFAAPHVAATLGLILSVDPTLTSEAAKEILFESVTEIDTTDFQGTEAIIVPTDPNAEITESYSAPFPGTGWRDISFYNNNLYITNQFNRHIYEMDGLSQTILRSFIAPNSMSGNLEPWGCCAVKTENSHGVRAAGHVAYALNKYLEAAGRYGKRVWFTDGDGYVSSITVENSFSNPLDEFDCMGIALVGTRLVVARLNLRELWISDSSYGAFNTKVTAFGNQPLQPATDGTNLFVAAFDKQVIRKLNTDFLGYSREIEAPEYLRSMAFNDGNLFTLVVPPNGDAKINRHGPSKTTMIWNRRYGETIGCVNLYKAVLKATSQLVANAETNYPYLVFTDPDSVFSIVAGAVETDAPSRAKVDIGFYGPGSVVTAKQDNSIVYKGGRKGSNNHVLFDPTKGEITLEVV